MFSRLAHHQCAAAGLGAAAVLSVLLGGNACVQAQSGSRIRQAPSRNHTRQVPPGSQSRQAPAENRSREVQSNLGLEGYCPVCVVEMKKWVRGKPEHRTTYDGKTYYFPSQELKAKFLSDPAKYVPALGGDCTVCFANGKRMAGDIHFASLYDHRLFLFPGEDQRQEFMAHSDKYADVDLALEGNCAVCRATMGQDVAGKPEFAAFYRGMRYLFPSPKERRMFLADPEKFAAEPAGDEGAAKEQPGRGVLVVRGKSGCAGCEHGVAPIGAPDTLGLAVTADDGQVYVVEDAHQLYSDVYERRFDGLPLEVSGTALKSEGKITWIQPRKLKVLK